MVDFSQFYITEDQYAPGKDINGDPSKDTLLDLMNTFRDDIDQLDANLLNVQKDQAQANDLSGRADVDKNTLVNFLTADSNGTLKYNDPVLAAQTPKASLTQDQMKKIMDSLANLPNISSKKKAVSANESAYVKGVAAVLSAAVTFEQVLLGTVDAKYPLASNSNSPGSGPSSTNTVATVIQPGGTVTTVNLVTSSTTASNTSNNGSGQNGNNSATTIPSATSPSINLIEKYTLLEQDLRRMRKDNLKLVSAQVLVGDATQATVTRALLENYVAISGRAVVELQVFDLLKGEYDFSDHQEADHQYVYFPSRIRDGAENKWKDQDLLSHPRDVPSGDLNWYTRFDQAKAAARVQNHPILVELVNSGQQPFPVTSDSDIFNDNDFRAFAASRLILDQYDSSQGDEEYRHHNLGMSDRYSSRVRFLLYDPEKKFHPRQHSLRDRGGCGRRLTRTHRIFIRQNHNPNRTGQWTTTRNNGDCVST